MLIEFSVTNFRSFREKQTFSMVATPRLGKKDNVFKPDIKGEKFPNLLKVAAIYGPNASGKSNLIKAFNLISSLTKNTSERMSKNIPVAPFKFDPLLENEPSRFEVHFIVDGLRYEFELAATAERVMEERLISYPRGKEVLLYHRRYVDSGDQYEFGDALEGEPLMHNIWRKLTSKEMLFISQAVFNSNEELQQLRRPLSWLKGSFSGSEVNIGSISHVVLSFISMSQNQDSEVVRDIPSFLQEVDVPITKITTEFEDELENENTFSNQSLKEIDKEKIQSILNSQKKITLTHKTALGEAQFDLSEESDGTKNLIGFYLPWKLMSGGSSDSKTYFIDELDSSLHPEIVASLIKKLIQSDKFSQLIFTTHDTHLMDTKLLRRDQIWLTERDMNGATQLRSIHDFKGREGEDIEKRYYDGRYRALPILKKN